MMKIKGEDFMSKLIDLTGKRFGRLIVIRRISNDKRGQPYWLCKCNCGKEKNIRGSSLWNSVTKSCGCLSREKTIERLIIHGHCRGRKTRIYYVWRNMIDRCTNYNRKDYQNYGGRGIVVCERWRKFENFLEDMDEVSKGHQIDRIDNNKGYYKENCRWVTSKINNRNKRNNHSITYDGKTQCLAAWAEELNIPKSTLRDRIFKFNWSVEKAITTPVRKWRKHE